VLTEMVLWASAHEHTENQALVREMQNDKQGFLERIRKRCSSRSGPPKRSAP
jgi:hypothetical protein